MGAANQGVGSMSRKFQAALAATLLSFFAISCSSEDSSGDTQGNRGTSGSSTGGKPTGMKSQKAKSPSSVARPPTDKCDDEFGDTCAADCCYEGEPIEDGPFGCTAWLRKNKCSKGISGGPSKPRNLLE